MNCSHSLTTRTRIVAIKGHLYRIQLTKCSKCLAQTAKTCEEVAL